MFMVYWSSLVGDQLVPGAQAFTGKNEMSDALKLVEQKRKEGARFVTFISENFDSVGKPGVDAVVNGKTPDGLDYEWTKKHRGEAPEPGVTYKIK